jgi:hypothetical protein
VQEVRAQVARILLDFDADAEKIRDELLRKLPRQAGPAPRRPVARIIVYCPSCDTQVESIGSRMAPGRFAVEGDGAQTCRRCGAVWHLSYRVEWRMLEAEGV